MDQVIFPGLVRLIDALIDDRLDEVYHDLAEHFSSLMDSYPPAISKSLKSRVLCPPDYTISRQRDYYAWASDLRRCLDSLRS